MRNLPALSNRQIWNMSIGFLGIQFGFALQNANASRILQNFGADIEQLSWFWLAAPLTGMLIQPIVGHYSDRTWTRLEGVVPISFSGQYLLHWHSYSCPTRITCSNHPSDVHRSRYVDDNGCFF